MTDFFKSIHSKYYSDKDISFMEYFLELTEHEDKFYVHHSKLMEYGIVTSNRSSVIKEKLEHLLLIEGSDFLLQDILQQDLKHGGSNKKVYYLTPQAFKKCLMRARRYKDQSIDPVYFFILTLIY